MCAYTYTQILRVSIYIHIRRCAYIYIYVYICVCIGYIFMYICRHTYLHVYVHIYIYMCVCVYVFVLHENPRADGLKSPKGGNQNAMSSTLKSGWLDCYGLVNALNFGLCLSVCLWMTCRSPPTPQASATCTYTWYNCSCACCPLLEFRFTHTSQEDACRQSPNTTL